MADVIPARMTHDYDGDLVVFLIGMRINKPWRPDLWLPVFNAMPKMLAELSRDPDSGLLGYRLAVGAGGPLGDSVLELAREAVSLRKRSECSTSSSLGRVQSPSASGSRRSRHLA
jgi:hypothetical protein